MERNAKTCFLLAYPQVCTIFVPDMFPTDIVMSKKLRVRNNAAIYLIFTGEVKEDRIEARLQEDTIRLGNRLPDALFDWTDGNTHNTEHYNLN